MNNTIADMPRVRFYCGHDTAWGPEVFTIGVYWAKVDHAEPGQFVYRKWLDLRFNLPRFSWSSHHARG